MTVKEPLLFLRLVLVLKVAIAAGTVTPFNIAVVLMLFVPPVQHLHARVTCRAFVTEKIVAGVLARGIALRLNCKALLALCTVKVQATWLYDVSFRVFPSFEAILIKYYRMFLGAA